MVDRRIIEGRLGCPICESQYPIHGGVVDLRLETEQESPAEPASHNALELAALLGVTSGPGFALLSGGTPALASELAQMVPELRTAWGEAAERTIVWPFSVRVFRASAG